MVSFFIMPTKIKLFNLYLDYNNMYFRLRFGLANSINTYLKLKIRVVRGGDIINLKCILIKFTIPKSESDLYLYISKLYKSSI